MPSRNAKMLCALGLESMSERVISRLEELGVSLFRINHSYTEIKDVL